MKEVQAAYKSLTEAYTIDSFNDDLSRAKLFKRKEEKPTLASLFDKMKEDVQMLSRHTNITFENKEKT